MNSFTMIDNTILNDTSLTITHKMVYVALASYIDNKTRSCYPSYATLAEKASCSRNTAIMAMKILIEKGYVIKVKKNDGKKNAHACNLYILAELEPNPNKPDSYPSDPAPSQKEADKGTDSATTITALEKLPSVREAFPQAKDLLDLIEEHHTNNTKQSSSVSDALPNQTNVLPSQQDVLPSIPVAPKLDLLNYSPLNYNQSIYHSEERTPYGVRDEIIEKLDKHFGYENFSSDESTKMRYLAITSYIAEMLIDPYTRICKRNMSREELAKMIFSTPTSAMRDFLRYLDQEIHTFATTKIGSTPAYFKTVFIEFLRSCQLIYGQCM